MKMIISLARIAILREKHARCMEPSKGKLMPPSKQSGTISFSRDDRNHGISFHSGDSYRSIYVGEGLSACIWPDQVIFASAAFDVKPTSFIRIM